MVTKLIRAPVLVIGEDRELVSLTMNPTELAGSVESTAGRIGRGIACPRGEDQFRVDAARRGTPRWEAPIKSGRKKRILGPGRAGRCRPCAALKLK